MVIAPASALGFLVIFLVGAFVTYIFLEYIPFSDSPPRFLQNERNKYKIAVGGGILAVALMILIIFSVPRDTAYGIFGILTVVGILFGISTFFWNRGSTGSRKPPPPPPPGNDRPPLRTIPYGSSPPHTPPSEPSNPYLDLLIRVHYDTALADRLIEYERKRLPKASMDELCRSAIERLEHDNR